MIPFARQSDLPPPEQLASIIAANLAPGVADHLAVVNDVAQKTKRLADFIEFEENGDWQKEPHLELLCNKLEKVALGEILRLMVYMPPRHGKSKACSQKFPPWYLREFPKRDMIITSYSADLAFDFSRIARDTIDHDDRGLFPGIRIDPGARAVKRWIIEKYGGGVFAAGVGGPITGRGAHVGIIDDPFKNYEEAASETIRESVWNWYRSVFRTRLAPDGAIVLIMTRWHQNDLAGRLIDEMKEKTGEDWEIISLPAIAEKNDPLERKPGEALSPRFPIESLKTTKRAIGSYLFSALYQQNPRAKEGNLFKAHWFIDSGDPQYILEKYKRDGIFIPIYATMDFAIEEKQETDWNVIEIGAVLPGYENLVIEVIRFKDEGDGIADEIVRVQRKYKPLLFAMEEGQIRKAIWPMVKAKMKALKLAINSVFLVPIKDKVSRARTVQGQMRQGQWIAPFDAPWFEDWKEELLGFPFGTWDDQVDAHSIMGRVVSDGGEGFFDDCDLS